MENQSIPSLTMLISVSACQGRPIYVLNLNCTISSDLRVNMSRILRSPLGFEMSTCAYHVIACLCAVSTLSFVIVIPAIQDKALSQK